MVTKAVECYKSMRNWDAILNCVKNHESDFTQEQREQLIKRYVPLALNSLYSLITNDVDEGEESEEEVVPRESMLKDYEVKTENVIDEESSESDSEMV